MYAVYNRWPDILWVFYGRHTKKSIARWQSFGCRLLVDNVIEVVQPSRSAPYRIACTIQQNVLCAHILLIFISTSIRTETETCRNYSMFYLKCSYFQTPSSCDSGMVKIASMFAGSFLMSCWMYCCTAKVLSISSNGSSCQLRQS